MRFYTVLACIFFFIKPVQSYSQVLERTYIRGVITTLKGDKIEGLIEQKFNYSGQIRYKFSDQEKPKKIHAKQILSVEIGTALYRQVNYRSKFHLMKELIKGPMSLFTVSLPDINTPSIPFDNRYSNQEFYIQYHEDTYKIPKEGFNRFMSELLSEHLDLAKKVFNKEYVYDDLIKIVTDYNYWYHYTRKSNR